MAQLSKNSNTWLAVIHKSPQYAHDAALIMAREWKHQEGSINRNMKSMTTMPAANIPCHVALVLKLETQNSGATGETVIGHAKLSRADGRCDGPCCILYSVVVDLRYRGMGYGRILMDNIECYVKEIGISYIYLSTPDKVAFYKHLGYKESEEVSSLRDNAKYLNNNQIANLESLFAKRLDLAPVTAANVWLRKRLIFDSNKFVYMEVKSVVENLLKKLLCAIVDEGVIQYYAYLIRTPFQQQVGPSCGVVALNMAFNSQHVVANDNLDDHISRCIQCSIDHAASDGVSTCSSPVEFAIKSGISYDGELFCAYNFSYLAQQCFHKKLYVSEIAESSFSDIVFSILNRKLPVFIPYDRSLADHTPGKFNGQHAHWAIINGFICKTKITDVIASCVDESHVLSHEDLTLETFSLSCLSMDAPTEIQQNETFFICSHGMSEKSFLTSYNDLIASNQQLTQCKTNIYLATDSLCHLRNKIVFIS